MSHILVIDDEPSISEVICRFLTKFGHTVETATDGLHGLRLFKNGSFDLVITDMCIPNIDGPCIVSHLRRSNRPSTPIVGISATPWKFEGVDCDAFLSKPFSMMELLDKVKFLSNKTNSDVAIKAAYSRQLQASSA